MSCWDLKGKRTPQVTGAWTRRCGSSMHRPTWSLQAEPEGAPTTGFLPGRDCFPQDKPQKNGAWDWLASPAAPNLKHRSSPAQPGRGGSGGETTFWRALETAFSFRGSNLVKSWLFDKIRTTLIKFPEVIIAALKTFFGRSLPGRFLFCVA